jgi:hypothetical protein
VTKAGELLHSGRRSRVCKIPDSASISNKYAFVRTHVDIYIHTRTRIQMYTYTHTHARTHAHTHTQDLAKDCGGMPPPRSLIRTKQSLPPLTLIRHAGS